MADRIILEAGGVLLFEEGVATDALSQEDEASFYLEDGWRVLLESVIDTTGTVAVTLGNLTSSASGSAGSVTGTVAKTLGAVTSAAAGASGATGTLAKTLGNATVTASGIHTVAGTVAGTVAVTLANSTAATAGTHGQTGSLAVALGNVTSAASGTHSPTGTVTVTLGDVTAATSGTHGVPGTLAVTLDNLTSTSTGNSGTVVGLDPFPAKCTLRHGRFTRRLRYHRHAERPALQAWAYGRLNNLIDFSDVAYTFRFRIGNTGKEALLDKTLNITGTTGTGIEASGTPNVTILWEPGELDIDPGTYDCQLIATSATLDAVFHGTIQIMESIN